MKHPCMPPSEKSHRISRIISMTDTFAKTLIVVGVVSAKLMKKRLNQCVKIFKECCFCGLRKIFDSFYESCFNILLAICFKLTKQSEAYSEHCEVSKMELSRKHLMNFSIYFPIFVKIFILDV